MPELPDAEGFRRVVANHITGLRVRSVRVLDAGPRLIRREFDELMSINLRGVYLCYNAAAKQMIMQGDGGKIIGAASIVGYRPFPLLAHYPASKWPVRGSTVSTASGH